jgi:potassium-dependent mechanosensitive channel
MGFKKICVCVLMVLPSALLSQSNITIPVTPHIDVDSIKPYPLTGINTAIELLDGQLVLVNEELQPKAELIRYQEAIKASQEYVKSEQLRLETEGKELSNWQLDDIKREWQREKVHLKTIQKEVALKVKWCIETIEYVRNEKHRWRMTKESIRESVTSAEMSRRISSIISLIESIEAKLTVRQDKVLALENGITDALLGIDGLRMEFEKLRTEIESQIFERDCPAIWNAFGATVSAGKMVTDVNRNFRNNAKFIEVFFYQNRSKVVSQLLIFIGALVLLLFLRTQLNDLVVPLSQNEMIRARYVTAHFVGSSLLIGLVSTGVIHSNIPTSVREFLLIGFIVSCILMIPIRFERAYRKYALAVIVLFFIHELEFLLEGKLLFNRFFLLLESVLSFGILYFLFSNKGRLLVILDGVWWHFVWRVKYLLYGLIVVSVFANVLGYWNLAVMLTKVTVYSLFFAIVLSVAQLVLQGTLVLLLHTHACNKSHLIAQNLDFIKSRINSILQYALVLVWVRATLISIGYYDSLIDSVVNVLDASWTLGTSTISLKGILVFIGIIAISQLVARSVKKILVVEFFPRIVLPRGVPGALSMLVSYFVGGIGFYLAISSAGVDLNKFSLIAGALGVGIGFGLQNIVHNFISGLILAFERPIQVGDTIDVGHVMGIVKKIGIRSSSISTFDGSEVIVPNSDLISKEVVNWTLSNQTRRREIPVGVAYGNHPEKVLEVLRNAVREFPDILSHPLPLCLFDGFGDSALKFRVLFWVPVDAVLSTQSNLGIAIYNALEEAGIEVPFPQQDVHIKSYLQRMDNTMDA